MKELIKYRHNIMEVDSPAAFARVRGGYHSNCKDVYFVRMLGFRQSLVREICEMDEKLSEEMQGGRVFYKRLSALPRLSAAEDADYYASCYERWETDGQNRIVTNIVSKVSKGNETLACQLADACKNTINKYQAGKAAVTGSIRKNFVVKLLYWFDYVYSGMEHWDARDCIKIVSDNVVKEQEYLFYYFLTLTGCDVLLIQSREDVPEERNKNLSKEIRLGGFCPEKIPEYSKNVQKSPNIPNINNGIGHVAGQDSQKIVVKIPKRDRRRTSQSRPDTGSHPQNDASSNAALGDGTWSVAASHGGGQSSSASLGRGAQPSNMQPSSVPPYGENRPLAASNPVSHSDVSFGRSGSQPLAVPPMTAAQDKSFEELAMLASSIVLIAVHNDNGDVVSTGSGIMVGKDGYILTNNHVARGGRYYSIRIENDDQVYQTDELIKYHSDLDLALMRISRRLEPLPIYKGTKELVRGQAVVAIGSPLGLFNSVSNGIISGFRILDGVHMIQFTAPISRGSSGGAVLNMRGEVIGISTAGFDQGQNINLAVGYESINMFIRGFQ